MASVPLQLQGHLTETEGQPPHSLPLLQSSYSVTHEKPKVSSALTDKWGPFHIPKCPPNQKLTNSVSLWKGDQTAKIFLTKEQGVRAFGLQRAFVNMSGPWNFVVSSSPIPGCNLRWIIVLANCRYILGPIIVLLLIEYLGVWWNECQAGQNPFKLF